MTEHSRFGISGDTEPNQGLELSTGEVCTVQILLLCMDLELHRSLNPSEEILLEILFPYPEIQFISEILPEIFRLILGTLGSLGTFLQFLENLRSRTPMVKVWHNFLRKRCG